MRMQWRFAVVVFALACTALLLQARTSSEIIPARTPLGSFPHTLGGWDSRDIPISKDVLDILGPGDFLLRDYFNSASQPAVNLFIAYFPSQRYGDAIHSPKNCLPGAGWSPVESERITINVGGVSFPVNRYVIAKGESRQLVLYSYWAHDRIVASEYWAKFYLVADSIRMHRSDGSLVRLTTYLGEKESVESGQSRLLSLAGNIVPLIPQYVPR
jgi:EpsI family protein